MSLNPNESLAELLLVRSASQDDLPFFYSTWLKGLRWGNPMFELIEQEKYFKNYTKVIDMLLERPNTEVRVAVLKDDPEIILGYSIFEEGRLHWVHVKKAWRRMGIAKMLVPETCTEFSHVTETGKRIIDRSDRKMTFNPFL